jgi:hypothetical protein
LSFCSAFLSDVLLQSCTSLLTGQMVGLPADFLSFTENSKGGGVMQVTLSLI